MAEKAKAKGKKIGNKLVKCAAYRARNNAGKTAKARRVFRGGESAMKKSWYLTSDGKTVRPVDTNRKKAHKRKGVNRGKAVKS